MSSQIGDLKSINGTSTALNSQKGAGTAKPSAAGGSHTPACPKPDRVHAKPVPMPKGSRPD